MYANVLLSRRSRYQYSKQHMVKRHMGWITWSGYWLHESSAVQESRYNVLEDCRRETLYKIFSLTRGGTVIQYDC